VDNLPHILRHGLIPASSPDADSKFRAIGDQSLIGIRKDLGVPIPPGGNFSAYIPFYLGHRSPMLYQIATGYEGVTRISQEEIIYIVVSHDCIAQKALEFVFTDGHARHNMTQFFNQPEDFAKLDWDTIYSEKWHNTQQDPDRQRRKQAEYLVKKCVPVDCFSYLLVNCEKTKQKVESLLQTFQMDIPVKISKKAYYDQV
jgi:hypothetical protein